MKETYYNEAKERIEKELDVADILMTLRNLKLFMSVLLKRNQKLILELNKNHVLQPDKGLNIKNNKVSDDESKNLPQLPNLDGFSLIDTINDPKNPLKSEARVLIQESLISLNLRNSEIDKKLYSAIFDDQI